jgi:dihydroorotate dehydrogenase
MVIIGSGGIMTAQDAINRRQAGSDLIQLYTGWIYGGPKFPFQIAEALTANNVK